MRKKHGGERGLRVICLYSVLGAAATCSEGFAICFLEVPHAGLGSMAAAVQPNSLGNSQKKVNKTFGTSGRPTRYKKILFLVAKTCHIIQYALYRVGLPLVRKVLFTFF